jgi:hypothetical protein
MVAAAVARVALCDLYQTLPNQWYPDTYTYMVVIYHDTSSLAPVDDHLPSSTMMVARRTLGRAFSGAGNFSFQKVRGADYT